MPWKKLLSLVTGSSDEELRLRNEYFVTENRILRSKLNGRPQLKDEERRQLAIIGKQLGGKALVAVATIVKPETISPHRVYPRGRPLASLPRGRQIQGNTVHFLCRTAARLITGMVHRCAVARSISLISGQCSLPFLQKCL